MCIAISLLFIAKLFFGQWYVSRVDNYSAVYKVDNYHLALHFTWGQFKFKGKIIILYGKLYFDTQNTEAKR